MSIDDWTFSRECLLRMVALAVKEWQMGCDGSHWITARLWLAEFYIEMPSIMLHFLYLRGLEATSISSVGFALLLHWFMELNIQHGLLFIGTSISVVRCKRELFLRRGKCKAFSTALS